MARTTAIQTSFNAGELTPRLHGRIDTQVYRDGVASMLGWLGTVQGAAIAAPGTIYLGPAKGPFRCLPFEYDVDQAYMIEASAGTFRFYANHARLTVGGGAPLEVATPYSYDQVKSLDYQQSADVLYLVHRDVKHQQLQRTGGNSFELVPLLLKNGPFEDGNLDQSITVSASVAGGGVPVSSGGNKIDPGDLPLDDYDTPDGQTLTANADIFAPGDVGGLFQIEAGDFANVPMWEPGITITSGSLRAWSGRVYQAAGGGKTGTVPPVHDSGIEYDGMSTGTDINGKSAGGVQWVFAYNRYGVVRISAYTDARHVSYVEVQRIANNAANWRWAFGAFSDRRGWPSAVAIWRERLVLAKGDKLYGSVVGDYTNFARYDSSGDFQRDLSFSVSLPNPDTIRWLAADVKLVIGTDRAEHAMEQVDVQTGSAGPPVMNAATQSTFGTARVKPILADGRVLFVQRAGRKLLEMGYAIESDRYEAPDIIARAEHLGAPGFVELAWQQEPERHLWAVRGDGSLACMVYARSQQVSGWAPRQLGAGLLARTAATIDAPDGRGQDLWIGVETASGWWMLRGAKIWETGDDQSTAQFLDAALTYSGAPIAAGGGASHLAGRTVQVLADGKPHADIVIGSAGGWQLSYPASTVTLGLPFPAGLRTLPIEAGATDGTAQGKLKRIPSVTLRVLETQGLRISVDDDVVTPVELRVPGDAMNQAVPLKSGDISITTGGLHERQGSILIERWQPTPATLLAVIPTVTTGDR